jgi:aminoglycoside phosphotransferase (APT) family kinase protein
VSSPDWVGELEERLGASVQSLRLVPGGASKEAWAVDTGGDRLIVRRAAGGVIHQDTLSLEHEFAVLEAAFEAGVKVPRPVAYLGLVGGREAFAMERVEGETIGRRIVKAPPPGLETQLADELAKIHAIPPSRVPFLEAADPIERLRRELDEVGEPHPAIEYGLWWLDARRPDPWPQVVTHGDFRIGNVVVDAGGLVALLDWEFARLADPRDDLSWPLVRAWRFGIDGLRLGGIGRVEPYLTCYRERTGLDVSVDDLYWWEVLGNAKWAVGALTQSRRHLNGLERSVELAVLGRLACEMEYELLDLIEQREDGHAGEAGIASGRRRKRAPRTHDRPTPAELAEATREFLESEILPTLSDHRLRFRALVAINGLGILQRELESGEDAGPDAEELVRRIRAGDPPPLDILKEHVAAKLRVANPRYLERYRAD